MCGRYTSTTEPAALAAYFNVDEIVADEKPPRYNVAPTDEVYAVADTKDDVRRLGAFRWGLVPFWAEDAKIGARMINARAETLLDKSAFRESFERRRCIVPADGFYEWETVPGQKKKQPWYIRRRDGEVLAFAGLWASWRPKDQPDAPRLVTCAIITTDANEAVDRLHDRMPVVLPRESWDAWLDPSNDRVDDLHGLLIPAPAALFDLYRVGPDVSTVRNDGPHLIEPVPC